MSNRLQTSVFQETNGHANLRRWSSKALNAAGLNVPGAVDGLRSKNVHFDQFRSLKRVFFAPLQKYLTKCPLYATIVMVSRF